MSPSPNLTAQIHANDGPNHLYVGVMQNGAYAGGLRIETEHAAHVVGIINAGTELVAALQGLYDVQDGPPFVSHAWYPGKKAEIDAWSEAMKKSVAALAKYEETLSIEDITKRL